MGKEFACISEVTGDKGSVPGSGRSPGEGNDNPLQYSCLENSMDRARSCKESEHELVMTERLTLHFQRFLSRELTWLDLCFRSDFSNNLLREWVGKERD